MDEIEKFINYIKTKFSIDDIRLARFIQVTELLTNNMIMEKVKEGEKIVEKPTNVLEFSYLKFCDKKFDDAESMLEKIFLFYIGYGLRESKNVWRLNLNNLETDIKQKCSYCTVENKCCPFKLTAYIKKCAEDNHFDISKIYSGLIPKDKVYSKDNVVIEKVANDIIGLNSNSIDIIGAEMLLLSDSIKIEKEENGSIYYKVIDFNVRDNSLFNNLNDFYKRNLGTDGIINISEINLNNSSSYIFNKSPIEFAVYIKYLCNKYEIDQFEVISRCLVINNFKSNELKVAYHSQYMHLIDELECNDKEKNQIKEILTYIKNYYYNEELPYIHFNLALYTKNNIISEKVVNIINRYIRTFGYIGNKGTLWVDTEMLVKRTKDSIDMLMQVDKIFSDNDFVIFENFSKVKTLNEYRVDALLTGIEKYSQKNKRAMFVMIGAENVINDLIKTHPDIENNIINKLLYIDGFNIEIIKEKILKRLENIMEVDEEFLNELEKYIERTYYQDSVDESKYIEKVCNLIVFNKFKNSKFDKKFMAVDVPNNESTRDVEEILYDINNLVGLTEVKETIKELLKYLDYSKKIDIEGFANLNMIFKGNSGTGKTTVVRLLAELYYKLGFIRQNKIIEVTSKDLIGSHIGETAPKTQAVIETALDGVLFIDDASTIMASRGGTSSNYPAECIGTICKAMEVYKDRLIVIFAGSTREMNEFIYANQTLMSRIGYELEFSDFSKDELMQIFNDEIKRNGFTLESEVEDKIEKIVVKNKISRNFGNARFITNLVDKLILIHSANYEDESLLKTITNKDVEIFLETKKDKVRGIDEIMEELNSLVGLKTVKETLDGFVSVIELNKKLNRMPDFNMHMIFKGNAGTGKTTVARLLAEIYYNLGYVKKNKLIEVQSQDLIGEFLGQTGPKTQAVIDSALDGVLFIDEAYSIMEHSGSNASYSAECIATLLKAMEDYQGRIIIIFAGYTEEMRKFRDLNPGLKSRIGYEINFDDYSIEELLQIFEKKVADKGFKANKSVKENLEKIFRAAKEVENFGNGRFVENTVQKIIIEHAKRTRNITDENRLIEFMEEDIPNIKAEESKKRIGF